MKVPCRLFLNLTIALLFGAAVFSPSLAAQVVRLNYAQLLVDDLLRTHAELLDASVCAIAPGATTGTVIAGARDQLGQPAGADDASALKADSAGVRASPARNRCEVVLPLRARPGETVGTLRLGFEFAAGQRESVCAETAARMRNRIQLVVPATHRMEVHMPLFAGDGQNVGPICTGCLWYDERQTADYYARSLAMRDELPPKSRATPRSSNRNATALWAE